MRRLSLDLQDGDVYRLLSEADKFKSLAWTSGFRGGYELLKMAHTGELKFAWGKVRELVEYGKAAKVLPDMPAFDSFLPVLSVDAHNRLANLLSTKIVRLPIICSSRDFVALDVPWSSNALDMSRSKVKLNHDGTVNEVIEGVFLRAQLDGDMFCVTRALDVYVTGRFLNQVVSLGLTGPKFKPSLRVGSLQE